ncbi:hypothetical protein H4R35_004670 [Dimargaris xerosporica]|nr:hypothetical protein H4R35_004670 [Dimargaris xerosporica]
MSDSSSDAPVLDTGNTAWVLTSAALVFLMVPGLGYFYSGMTTSKSALSLIFLCMLSLAVVPIQWYIWGYSLALSPTGGKFIGNLDYAFFRGVNEQSHPAAPTIPGTAYAIFQCMFSALTPALALGATAERVRLLPVLVFFFVWPTLVYDPIAYWDWGLNGYLAHAGSLDFAGGTPVHMASGFAALAYAMVLGRRLRSKQGEPDQPHNYGYIMLGTALLWFGWFGFNGGSAVSAGARAGQAMIVTHVAAAAGGLTWMLLQYRHDHKFSSFGFCCGAVAGLVAITPGSGFVEVWAALVYGVLGGAICHLVVELKEKYIFDDALDVFAVHGVGGLVGNLLTAFFATTKIPALDGGEIAGGWVDGHWKQLLIQFWECGVGAAWAFVVTYLILFIMNKIPFLKLRVEEESELLGLDATQMGEEDYTHKSDGFRQNTSCSHETDQTLEKGIDEEPMDSAAGPSRPERIV